MARAKFWRDLFAPQSEKLFHEGKRRLLAAKKEAGEISPASIIRDAFFPGEDYFTNGLPAIFLKPSASLAMASFGPASLMKMLESSVGTMAAMSV